MSANKCQRDRVTHLPPFLPPPPPLLLLLSSSSTVTTPLPVVKWNKGDPLVESAPFSLSVPSSSSFSPSGLVHLAFGVNLTSNFADTWADAFKSLKFLISNSAMNEIIYASSVSVCDTSPSLLQHHYLLPLSPSDHGLDPESEADSEDDEEEEEAEEEEEGKKKDRDALPHHFMPPPSILPTFLFNLQKSSLSSSFSSLPSI